MAGFDLEILRRDGLAAETDPNAANSSAGAATGRRDQNPALAHRRSATNRGSPRDAAGLVLMRCGQLRRAFWGWSPQDWIALIGAGGARLPAPVGPARSALTPAAPS